MVRIRNWKKKILQIIKGVRFVVSKNKVVIASSVLFCFASASATAALTEVGSFHVNSNISQMAYSDAFNSIVYKNTASAAGFIDLTTGVQSAKHFSNSWFTDLSLSPDGQYAFVSDYGGENIGYGTPLTQSYVHRLNLSNGSWEVKASDIAGNIEAISSEKFVLKSNDQWISFSMNEWGSNPSQTMQLGSDYYASVYSGNFVYDPTGNRLIHGNAGSSSQEIQTFKLNGNGFIRQEGSGTYGSAYGYGGSVVLSTDHTTFYYGSLQVDALDVSDNQNVFPEVIYAATGDIAFGGSNYYDAQTKQLLGSIGFNTSLYTFSRDGQQMWAFNPDTNNIHHFMLGAVASVPEPSAYGMLGLGIIILTLARRKKLES